MNDDMKMYDMHGDMMRFITIILLHIMIYRILLFDRFS